jgi:FAD/FMN-containing dehydrogenase
LADLNFSMPVITALSAVLLGLFACNALGDTTAVTGSANTCAQLRRRLGSSVIVLPSDAGYAGLRDENWSQTAWRSPWCIAVPTVAAEVASVVSYLADNCIPFAVRSGGHDPNPFDSNIDAGVLISLEKFASVSYDAETQLATVGPGARWEAVYTELDKYQRTMVGGRVMDVGVGGLTLGSGLSYLTDLYGLACDNIVSYEVRVNRGLGNSQPPKKSLSADEVSHDRWSWPTER